MFSIISNESEKISLTFSQRVVIGVELSFERRQYCNFRFIANGKIIRDHHLTLAQHGRRGTRDTGKVYCSQIYDKM